MPISARGQDIERKIQILREQYEAATKDFEQRLAALEDEIKQKRSDQEPTGADASPSAGDGDRYSAPSCVERRCRAEGPWRFI
jgi:hypothetical protein